MSKKQEVHVIHHNAPRRRSRKLKMKRPKKKKVSNKKVISVVVNIIDELVRLM